MTQWKTQLLDSDLKVIAQDFNQQKDFGPSADTKKAGIIGIGFETKRDGTYLRAAVEMRSQPSADELQEAVGLLFKAYTDPEASDVKVVRGFVELTPNAMRTSALTALIEAQSK